MLRGLLTNENYEECLKAGFCKDHLKELEIKDEAESYELQRKAMLYIRLQVFAPLLFNKPFTSDKMKTLFSKCKYFNDRENKNRAFREAIMVLDSVVVYTLCYFSKVCCAGVFYHSSKPKTFDDPLKQRIMQLLNKKILEESDISYFNPFLTENFTEFEKNLVKVSYVTALLCVRNVTMNLKLRLALDRLSTELHGVSREGEKWKIIGNDSYKEKRYEEAINAFTSAINYNPYCIPLLRYRAQTYLRIKQFDSAALDYYIILVLNPTSIRFYYLLSYSLLHYNRNYESLLVAEYAMEKFKDCKHTNPKLYESLERMREVLERNIERTFPVTRHLSGERGMSLSEDVPDIPDLIEASDSETETQDVPDLMDASDSDESEPEVLIEGNRNQENKNAIEPQKPEISYKDEKQEKRDTLCSTLKEASSILLDGCSLMAIPKYLTALDEIRTYPEVYSYDECDLMCIKYAYGCALCKSKSYDDLQKAVRIFKEIIEEHSTLMFPAAPYGIALAYYKLNWYKESLCYLKAVIDIIQKEIPFKECTWPGLTRPIEETKPECLKVLVNDLIKECENPPPPDAVCRFDKCSLRASIYLSDPDFKGFYFIQCSEQCCLQYHPQCWKIVRSAKQCTDKAFLEQKCFTPDCDGTICKIQNYSKDGSVEKEFSLADTKKLAKQKRAKVPKKAEVKEEKKRKRKDSTSKPEPATEENTCIGDNQPEMEVTGPTKAAKSDAVPEVTEDVPSPCVLSASAEPFIMLKKEKFVDEQPSKVSTKPKEHKKVKSNTFTIDEFLQNEQAYGNDYAQRLTALRANNQNIIEGSWTNCNRRIENLHNVPFEDPCNQNPFEIKPMLPSYGPSYASQLSAERQDSGAGVTNLDTDLKELHAIQCVKKEVYSYFKDLLQKHGPLSVNDPIIVNELKDFPPIANKVIANCNGVGGFLKQNMDFALVDEKYVCVVADVVAAYEKLSADTKINALPSYPAYSSQGDAEDVDPLNSSFLNPDAKEYLPTTENSEAAAENIHRNSPELISAISKLRQPLDVENNCLKTGTTLKQEAPEYHQDKPEVSFTEASSSYFDKVPKDSSLQEKVAALLEKFTSYVDMYYSEEMNKFRPYIDECMQPYSIAKMPKRNVASVQTETNEIEKASCGTMKTDEELDRLKEITCLLTEDKQELLMRLQVLQEERDCALSTAAKNQVEEKEFESIKKDCADLKSALNDEKSEFQRKEQMLETEITHLLEKLNKIEEVNSSQKFEVDEILSNNESMKIKVKELEGITSVLQNEKQSMKQSLESQIDTLTANIKVLEAENVQAKERAKYAEHLLLCLKKTEYLRRIDGKSSEAAQRLKQLQDGIVSFSDTMPPVLIRNLKLLSTQIKECIVQLQDIRKNFIVQMDEQINQVNNGVSLKDMQPINIKDLPEIPSWTNTTLNAQTPCWTTQIQMLSSANQRMPYPPLKLPEVANQPTKHQPSSPMKCPPPQNSVSKENAVSPPVPLIQSTLAPSVQNLFEACNAPVLKPQVANLQAQGAEKDSKSMLGAVSKESLVPAAASTNARQPERSLGASSLELGYSIKKGEAKKAVPSKVSQENLHHEPKNSYEKLLHKLHVKFPDYTQAQLMDFVKTFREQRKGKLSGLSMDCIINEVGLLIAKTKTVTPHMHENRISSRISVLQTHNEISRVRPNPSVLVNKSLRPNEANPKKPPVEKPTENKCPWAKGGDGDSSRQWSGNNIEDGCIICYEDMSRNPYRVDCGHCFHYKCIKEWLSKKSDCPICRVHLLLPDDYPELK